jgi:hypothetical protein
MWIAKHAYQTLLAGFTRREQELLRTIENRESTIDQLRGQLRVAQQHHLTAVLQGRNWVTKLIGDTRAAQTRADLLAIDINVLREERAILLDKALAGIGGFKPQVPHIGPAQRTSEPAVSFEDMGNEQAAATGLVPDPDPFPVSFEPGFDPVPDPTGEQATVGFGDDTPDVGAPGTVYNPADNHAQGMLPGGY